MLPWFDGDVALLLRARAECSVHAQIGQAQAGHCRTTNPYVYSTALTAIWHRCSAIRWLRRGGD